MRQRANYFWVLLFILGLTQLISCKKDTTPPEVIASFTFAADASDFLTINFTNASKNYATVSWDFGDGSAVSSEVNPTHTYASAGSYQVTLTATSSSGSKDISKKTISLVDPNAELTKLTGQTSKSWKLLRVPNGDRYPLLVMPQDMSTVWWAAGLNNNEIANRPCMFNDEFIFGRDGSMTYDAHGDYWAEGGMFNPDNTCEPTTSMVGPNGEDLSAWGSGTHQFKLLLGTTNQLRVIGHGAFVGFYKLGNQAETKVPLDSVTYDIVKLYDAEAGTDTLIIQGVYHWDGDNGNGGIWQFVLVHYDNPADEPPMPGKKPTAGFTMSLSGLTATFTNTTTDGTSYSWDFGDGGTSTDANPVHTFNTDGIYIISLTATNANGDNATTAQAFVTNSVLTDALLKGAAWKVRVEDYSIFVGSGLGRSDWWSVSKSFMTSGTGGDDWTCITNDEFQFADGGVYTYKTNGSTRNDGWWGDPHGCVDDAAIASSSDYGPEFGSATHSYAFTPASGTDRAVITLTNGTLTTGGGPAAAFIGFYKGYYGGENTDRTVAPNGGSTTNTYEVMGYANTGTVEYLFLSVDISAAHDGSSAWSVILQR